MNKKVLLFSLLALGLFSVLGISAASAHGWFSYGMNATPEEIVERQTTMFESKADLLGVNVDTIKSAWAEGKSLVEIAEENGLIQEDLKAKMLEAKKVRMQEHLQILVDNGVISQSQADSRLQFMQDRMTNGKFGRKGRMGMGFMKGFGCPYNDSQ